MTSRLLNQISRSGANNTAVILSIKPTYATQILAGSKNIELRRSAMGLRLGDVVLVYVSAPEQCLGFWFRIAAVETLPVDEMWRQYEPRLGITHQPYVEYFSGVRNATGLHVGELHPLTPTVSLAEIRSLVPGFVPPQGHIALRDAWGRYERLLNRLSCPLPPDVFPQEGLFRSVSQAVGQ
jgi:predicted transcriptional regulator